MVQLLITNGTIIIPEPKKSLIIDGCIIIDHGKIMGMGRKEDIPILPEAKKTLDAGGGLILPGLVNTHTHAAMTLFRGLADDLPLMEWLNRYIFPAESRFLDPESVYWGTLLACAEMLLSGTTTFSDGYFFEEAAFKAADQAGMRGILAQGVIDLPAPGVPDPKQNIQKAKEFIDKTLGISPRLTPGIFCHSAYTCSPETLKAGKALARSRDVPFFIHLAETKAEVEEIHRRFGKTPVAHTADLGILDKNTIAVHGIWLTREDMEILVGSGCGLASTPESEMKLASGLAPIPELLDMEMPIGLGTDGPASNNDLDLIREMRTMALIFKGFRKDPVVLNAREVLWMATAGGAGILGLGQKTGKLTIGMEADLMVLDTNQPHLTPLYDPVSHVVYAAKGSDCRHVVIGGVVVVEDRRILTFDLKEVMGEVLKLAGRIKKSF